MKCLHCGEPVTRVQAVGSPFHSWRHLDGRMFCSTGGTIATPRYGT